MFDGFVLKQFTVSEGITINYRTGGSGPALLLLHGHPQTHAMWHRVAPSLAENFTLVMPDLRGYGDSSKPEAGENCIAYSKRIMAEDMILLMRSLGYDEFFLGAHDRGARVAHRAALDYPQHIKKLFLMDIAPTLDMYEGTGPEFATAYWHWFLFIQPAPFPERMIEPDPVSFIRRYMGARYAGLEMFCPEALSEYERCYALPGTVGAVCNDYRASAGIDLDLDREDRKNGNHLAMPLHVLWAQHGVMERCFDVLELWKAVSKNRVTGHNVECGHYLAEEAPDLVAREMATFFNASI